MPTPTETRSFPLRTVLSVTTGRLLTAPKNGGNGIEDMYDLLGFITNDAPFTHQLGRFADEVRPWLLQQFPELGMAKIALGRLDVYRKEGGSLAAVNRWLAELVEEFPEIKESYEIARMPAQAHTRRDPLEELAAMTQAPIAVMRPADPEAET